MDQSALDSEIPSETATKQAITARMTEITEKKDF